MQKFTFEHINSIVNLSWQDKIGGILQVYLILWLTNSLIC